MADLLFDAVERAQLSDLFDELGPQAPTLLAPWTTRDLAAHLVLRERAYLAGPGLVLPGAWGRLAERRRRALALRDFTWLSATIRSGPPPGFFRIGWVRRLPNLNEFFVHHEDVRRANGRGPRTQGSGKVHQQVMIVCRGRSDRRAWCRRAAAMLAVWVRRKMVIARLRRLAMTRGPLPVRTWDRSSPNVTSRTQWSRSSMDQ